MQQMPFTTTATFRDMGALSHTVHVRERTRKMLSAVNDKIYMVDTATSRPLGHYLNEEARLENEVETSPVLSPCGEDPYQ